jgi:hypothetical protein
MGTREAMKCMGMVFLFLGGGNLFDKFGGPTQRIHRTYVVCILSLSCTRVHKGLRMVQRQKMGMGGGVGVGVGVGLGVDGSVSGCRWMGGWVGGSV